MQLLFFNSVDLIFKVKHFIQLLSQIVEYNFNAKKKLLNFLGIFHFILSKKKEFFEQFVVSYSCLTSVSGCSTHR